MARFRACKWQRDRQVLSHSCIIFKSLQSTNWFAYCCPVSTSIRGAAIEVAVNNLHKPSVVAASLVQTLSWKQRNAKFIVQSDDQVVEQVLLRLLPLIGADKVLEQYLD